MYYKHITINGTKFDIAVNIVGSGAPTTATEGSVGMIYMDESDGKLYKCTSASRSEYVWAKVIPESVSEFKNDINYITADSEQALSDEQKSRARANIGAATKTEVDASLAATTKSVNESLEGTERNVATALSESEARVNESLEATKDDMNAALESTVEAVDASIASSEARVASTVSRIDANSKRITNIERSLSDDMFVTDDSVAYVKGVPENALPYAALTEFGGMSRADGGVMRDAKVTAVVSEGVNMANCTASVTTAGLSVQGVDGRCILNGTATSTVSADLATVWLDVGTYTLGASGLNDNGNDRVYIKSISNTIAYPNKTSSVKISTAGTYKIAIVAAKDSPYVNKDIELFMYKGEVSGAVYTPYIGNTFAIPEAVQTLEGYGEGLSAAYHNGIVLDPANGVKKFVKRCERLVFDGTEAWAASSDNVGNRMYAISLDHYGVANMNTPLICTHYDHRQIYSSTTDIGCCIYAKDKLRFRPDTPLNQSITAWENYLAEQYAAGTPVTVVYALAEPEETDVGAYFGDDNFIPVHGGGAVIAVNDGYVAVPSKVEYMLKEVAE